jgi:hypothetical protein
MRRIFWGFCMNWFGIGTLHYVHYVSSRSDSPTRHGDSPTRVEESTTLRLAEFSLKHSKADSPTQRVGESFIDYENLREFEFERKCKGSMRNQFLQKLQKIRSLPCLFKTGHRAPHPCPHLRCSTNYIRCLPSRELIGCLP